MNTHSLFSNRNKPTKNFRHMSEEFLAKVGNGSFRMNGWYICQVAWPKIAVATRCVRIAIFGF